MCSTIVSNRCWKCVVCYVWRFDVDIVVVFDTKNFRRKKPTENRKKIIESIGWSVVLWLFVLIKNARCTLTHSGRTEIRSCRFAGVCFTLSICVDIYILCLLKRWKFRINVWDRFESFFFFYFVLLFSWNVLLLFRFWGKNLLLLLFSVRLCIYEKFKSNHSRNGFLRFLSKKRTWERRWQWQWQTRRIGTLLFFNFFPMMWWICKWYFPYAFYKSLWCLFFTVW